MDVIAKRMPLYEGDYLTSGTGWAGSFHSETGSHVSVSATLRHDNPKGDGALGSGSVEITVSYDDLNGYFSNAPRLYPFISILKVLFRNQGVSELTTHGRMVEMEAGASGQYEATFSSQIESDRALHQEFFVGLTMAFTSTYPHSGQGKWDSNGHKNHGWWIR
jgi:hypothetical protein